MPKYRVKSGRIYLKMKKGKQFPAVANDVVTLTVETATKFKDQLTPMSPDAIFIDELDEFSEIASREVSMKMVPIEGEKGFYNVQNTITGKYVNSAPLSGKDAMDLIKGTNVKSVFDEYDEKGLKENNIDDFVDEEGEEIVKEKPKKKKSEKKDTKKNKTKTEKKDKKKKKKKKSED